MNTLSLPAANPPLLWKADEDRGPDTPRSGGAGSFFISLKQLQIF